MPSLTSIRRALAAKPGLTYVQGTTGVWNGSAYTGVATGSDAQRVVLSSDFARLDRSGAATDFRVDHMVGAYAYIPGTSQQESGIVANGYSAYELASNISTVATSDPVGYYVVAKPWLAVLTAAQVAEIHGPLPVRSKDGLLGLHDCINRALRVLLMRSRITIAGVTGSKRYSLAAYPWITSETQLVQVFAPELVANTDPDPLAGVSFLRMDNQTPYLIVETETKTGTNFSAEFLRPAASWIKVGSTWAESTVGLVSESDECTGDLDEIAALAYVFVCEHLSHQDPHRESSTWTARYRAALQEIAPALAERAQRIMTEAQNHARNPDHSSTAFRRGSSTGVSWQ